jgi:hypothetical protein
MSDQGKNRTANDAGRRLFLEKAGRFAAVTPPAVALMLSATGKARATGATSGATTTTITTVSGSTTITVTESTTTTVTITSTP